MHKFWEKRVYVPVPHAIPMASGEDMFNLHEVSKMHDDVLRKIMRVCANEMARREEAEAL